MTNNRPWRAFGVGGNRARTNLVTQAIGQLETIAANLDQFELGIRDSVNEQPDAITHRGQPDDHTQRHTTLTGDPALTALTDFDELLHSITDLTRSARRMQQRWAAQHTPDDPPDWACEAMWPHVPLDAAHTGRVGNRLPKPARLSEPAYAFVRRNRRLPTAAEVEHWRDNNRTWPKDTTG